ncbi:MAG: nucleotidyltransferase domain-containing protein [Candidatus Nanoarchaeia archaeon]|nr:nucleotidyltransferase domain-containing protein [Candidatus Nanoarchaeia archaeon]
MKKLTRPEAIKIVKGFIDSILVHEEWYKQILKHIKAIVLYGSVAKEKNRPDSDIDVLVFVPLAIEEKYTKGEYFYNYDGYEINMVLRSIERLRKLAKENNNKFQIEVFRQSEIITETDDEVRVLIKKLVG